ncbi:MAG: glycosyltransferase family 1 protein [Chloroflexi bacterium AL-W]|nr:glycosyltransferase family 1 protein [Chloroflexi bacterium AL-N1]NOK68237.1 glycosyltransferase family 1 protein [Chloroflexi bacterium AL-N10]NOK73883.1 glycosyltransferase family 1 protein [Chloroflexi bacterium AL-N5]NOK82851.1 glycosyltransferase family 1 protein [Chloroflexi bacterium AL-W]NOK90373.1 glycosyltransferase family 1 protein [Chloroflexi bacterium AL-N15]
MPGHHTGSVANMHIGFIIYGSLGTVSGGYLYDRQLVSYLRKRGHPVGIVSLPWRNYPLHVLDNFRRLQLSHFDLLLQDELNHPSLFLMNKRITIPTVSIVHHLRSSEEHPACMLPLYRHVEQHYLNSVDAFIFNSNTTQAIVGKHLHRDKPYVVAMPSGNRFTTITEEEIIERTTRSRPLNILFVGNLIPRKGLDTLLQAIINLPVYLTVIGSTTVNPDYTHSIQTFIDAHHLTETVCLKGQVSDAELGFHFTNADVLAVPSQYEGFGIVYLEGMGFGLPAIGTTAGAAHEIITHGQNGFLISPGQSDVLVQYLRQLFDQRVLQKMSLAALKRSKVHPTWEHTFLKVEQFLCKLAQ